MLIFFSSLFDYFFVLTEKLSLFYKCIKNTFKILRSVIKILFGLIQV